MKLVSTILTAMLGIVMTAPESEARGGGGGGGGQRGGGGGRAKASAPARSGGGGGAKRSPMTGSKVQRPASRPAPKPASRPQTKPAPKPNPKPAPKPAQRPSVQKPDARPGGGPANLPDRKPDARPGGGGDRGPDKRPSVDRPDKNKPATLPGMVTYPNRPDKGKPGKPGGIDGGGKRPGPGGDDRPGIADGRPGRDNNRPGVGPERPGRGGPSIVDRGDKVNIGGGNRTNIGGGNRTNIGRGGNNLHIDNINVGRKNVGLNRPGNLNKRDWDSNKWGGNNSVWGNKVNIGNNVNVNINNRFRNNNNFACRPNYWGSRPWWGAGNYHGWHHGHWGYGWNSNYYRNHWWFHDDNDFAEGFMWGIAAWSLGSMIYDMGYQSYKNPYPAPPVQNTYVTYTQPVSTAAAANPPGDEATAASAEEKSDDALERSRTAFKSGDYLAASKAVDEAISFTPGDVTLHEYRALVFFALGKYSDAAGVLNPVLASGPGWSWDTMIGFYGGSSTYSDQLKKLEAYAKGSDKPDGHFLLGYHYMVCGHMDKAHEQFAKAAEQQPADTISRQLRDLTGDSIPDADAEASAEAPAPPPPVPSEKLVGTWTSKNDAGTVTFSMKESGDFTWSYSGGGNTTDLKGTYGLNDKGLLVLTTDDTQMVSAVSLEGDAKMKFMLVGAPDGDPGMDFTKG